MTIISSALEINAFLNGKLVTVNSPSEGCIDNAGYRKLIEA